MLGLVDDVMAHGAFLPVVGFVMLPLVLVGDHGDRLGLGHLAHIAGVGLHASFGAGGGRSLNAGIPRMCSLVHNGAAAVHVPVVVLVGLPLVAHIAGAVSMRLVLFLAADAALDGMLRCAIRIAANDQYPLMPGGRDCYFFDRRLFTNSPIVVEIIIIATGTKPVGNTTVAVAGRLLCFGLFQVGMRGLIDHLFGRGGNLRVRVLVQLTASAPIILIIAILSAGMRLGGNLSQCVGTTGVRSPLHNNIGHSRSSTAEIDATGTIADKFAHAESVGLRIAHIYSGLDGHDRGCLSQAAIRKSARCAKVTCCRCILKGGKWPRLVILAVIKQAIINPIAICAFSRIFTNRILCQFHSLRCSQFKLKCADVIAVGVQTYCVNHIGRTLANIEFSLAGSNCQNGFIRALRTDRHDHVAYHQQS